MKISKRKIRRFFMEMKIEFLRLAVYLLLMFLAIFAVCLFLTLPEIIATLILGY